MLTRVVAGIALLTLVACTGCGNAEATVSGKITLDGKALEKGDVSFKSTSGGAVANGAIDASGSYQLKTGTGKGLSPGSYQVTVVANEVIVPSDPYKSAVPRLLTPPKYSSPEKSGLTADVKPGANKFDFDLKSMP